ncbi:MAG TPA: extracellular solute-binding protein [Candidatus Limnocylindrales bacterium]
MATNRLSRRRLLTGGAGLAGAALLAACGDKGGVAEQGSETGNADSGALNWWGGVPPENGPNEAIAAFKQKFPKITVTYTRFVNDPTGNLKLDTALQGGTPIDLFYSYIPGDLQKRVTAGLTLDLTGRANADSELKFLTATDPQQTLLFDGKLHAVPTNKSTTFVFLNKDMLDAAGVTIPDGWDADDYHQIAKRLSSAKVFGSFNSPEIAVPVLGGNAIYKPGGQESNFDSPAWRRQIQLHVDMIADKSAFPQTEIVARKLDTYQQAAFLTGQSAMWISQPFSLRYVNDAKNYPHTFKTTFAPFPVPAKGQQSWTPGGLDNYLSISAKSQNQAAAWTFLRWLTGEGSQHMIAGGRIPVIGSVSQDVVVEKLLGSDMQARYDVEAFRKVYFKDNIKLPVATTHAGASEIATERTKLTNQVLLGQMTVDAWVSEMKSRADAAIKKGK